MRIIPAIAFLFATARILVAEVNTPLTNTAQIYRLTPTQMEEAIPVHLQGIVTYVLRTDYYRGFVLQDSTGGVKIDQTKDASPPMLRPGQWVEVEGATCSLRPQPQVQSQRVTPGRMQELPTPRSYSVEQLVAAPPEGFYVFTEGVIRAAKVEPLELLPPRLFLEFGPQARRLQVWVSQFEGFEKRLVPGTSVRVRGVCLRWKNERFQPTETFLVVNDPSFIQITEEAPTNRYAAPLCAIPDLPGAPSEGALEHPWHVRGVVTLCHPGELIVIQNGPDALRLKPADTIKVSPGDLIEAVGFPAMGECSAQLEDVIIRVIGHTNLPGPNLLSSDFDLGRDASTALDARLVRFRAIAAETFRQDGHWALELLSGNRRITAVFPAHVTPPALAQPGSEVELTGVYDLHLSESRRQLGYTADSIQFLLNTPDDLVVLRSAPWWTASRLLIVVISLLLSLLALGSLTLWIRRTNIKLRAEMLARAQAENRLTTERHRVAADLHDTLEQTLLGIDLQLDATGKTFETRPAAARTFLMLARQLLARGRQEVRGAVWDLHTEPLQHQNLSVLLKKAAVESSAGTGAVIDFIISGTPQSLPALVTSYLVRLTREVTNNAVKHGHAQHLSIHLTFSPSLLTLAIKDDGCGFEPAGCAGPTTGHFGISGMKERLARLNGTFDLQSQPGRGTQVVATVPLEPRPSA